MGRKGGGEGPTERRCCSGTGAEEAEKTQTAISFTF